MFWKIADLKNSSFSLTNKMVLLYWLTTMSIVILVCVILFPSFEKITHLHHTGYQHSLLSKCIEKLIIAILVSGFISILFAKIVAGKGMKQIELLSHKIKNITIDSLSTQIQTTNLPKELKPLCESFNVMLDKLQNSVKQISQFSSDIAHELRNPIHNLLGMNEIALMNPNLSEKHQEIFESNIEECRYLLKLIENLWFIAQSEHSDVVLNRTQLNIYQEITHIIEYYQFHAEENQIKISHQGEAFCYADQVLFKRAISNLLSNALRYTPKGGKVYIKSEKHLHETVISIQDTGCGIEDKHLPNIFNRFYRAESSRSAKTGGLGLGLAIVKSIMDLHHGKITIESQVNDGTLVKLHFVINS